MILRDRSRQPRSFCAGVTLEWGTLDPISGLIGFPQPKVAPDWVASGFVHLSQTLDATFQNPGQRLGERPSRSEVRIAIQALKICLKIRSQFLERQCFHKDLVKSRAFLVGLSRIGVDYIFSEAACKRFP
jgi:hypothetical protein